MTIDLTPRLGLSVDVNGEGAIDTSASNWNRVDQVSGVIYTTSGATIPDTDLYDGAIVAERDTGISWQAIWNGTSYAKRYINYPLFWVSSATNVVVPNNTNTPYGWKDVAEDQCLNSGKAQLQAGTNGFVIPIRATWDITMMTRWNPNSSGNRRSWYSVDGVDVNTYEEFGQSQPNGSYIYGQQVRINRQFNVGSVIRPVVWQNSGGGLITYFSVYATVVRPVYVVS